MAGQSTYRSSKIRGRVLQSPSMSRHSAGSGGMLVRYSESRMSMDSWLWLCNLGKARGRCNCSGVAAPPPCP